MKGRMHRPVDVLIMINAFIHHVTHGYLGVWQALILIINTPLGDFVGSDFCWITVVVGVYGLIYLSVGSCGIAIYRILYIRHDYWVKYIIGEFKLRLREFISAELYG